MDKEIISRARDVFENLDRIHLSDFPLIVLGRSNVFLKLIYLHNIYSNVSSFKTRSRFFEGWITLSAE